MRNDASDAKRREGVGVGCIFTFYPRAFFVFIERSKAIARVHYGARVLRRPEAGGPVVSCRRFVGPVADDG